MNHLKAPWGLPPEQESRLTSYFDAQDWAPAITLLRDSTSVEANHPHRILALAHALVQDAVEVMPDELGDACREALRLIDRATELDPALLDAVAPFIGYVHSLLDQVTRGEEALLHKLGPGDDASKLSDDELENAAFVLERSAPARAATLFTTLAGRKTDSLRHAFEARAALALSKSGQFAEARPALENALTHNWAMHPLSTERLTLEAVETELLAHATGAEFDALWQLATERGEALDFAFPMAWPHQEKLFARAIQLRDDVRARALAQRMEDEREEIPSGLRAQFHAVRSPRMQA